MADDFDRFIAAGLAPAERAADRQFVARVQIRIALEERLAAQRRLLVADLVKQLFGLMSLALAAAWIAQAAPIAGWFADSPAAGLAVLLAAFASLVVLFTRRSATERQSPGRL